MSLPHSSSRRTGAADGDEATGLMTHHLVQDNDTWQFVEQFIVRTNAHPAVKWVATNDVFRLT